MHLEVQCHQYGCLHLQNLSRLVRVVCDVYDIRNYRWVDLFILAGNQKTRYTDQLQLAPHDLSPAKEAVD
jgi:hypothetical protein